MAMVFKYRQGQDNDACQGGDVDFALLDLLCPHPHHTPGLCGGSAGMPGMVRFAQHLFRPASSSPMWVMVWVRRENAKKHQQYQC